MSEGQKIQSNLDWEFIRQFIGFGAIILITILIIFIARRFYPAPVEDKGSIDLFIVIFVVLETALFIYYYVSNEKYKV